MFYHNNILFVVKDTKILIPNSDFRNRHNKYITFLKKKKFNINFVLIHSKKYFVMDENYNVQIDFNSNLYKLFIFFLKNNYSKIVLQDTFLLSLYINIISKIKKKEVILQIHGELFSKRWILLSYKNPFKFLLSFINIMLSKKIRVVNNYTKKIILKIFKNKFVLNIPIPVLDHFEKKNFEILKNKKFNIAYISELINIKNPKLVIKICRELNKLNFNYAIFIIGDGALMNKIRNMVNKYELNNQVYILGKLKYEEIKKIYKNMNLTILTSKSESYSRVIVESFLNHTPVLSTKSTGPSELVKKEYLFNFDEEKIAKSIYNLGNNKLLLKKYMDFVEGKYANYNPNIYIDKWSNFIIE